MKRSFLMSALVLSLSIPLAACGGGGTETDKPPGDPAGGGDNKGGSDDPVVELQGISDGIQKDVDGIFQPIKDADAVLDSLGKLPADLKAAKSKVDAKKVMAEISKVIGGGEAALDALKMDPEGAKIVGERVDKVKALVASIKDLDQKVADLGKKIGEAVPKIPAIGAKAIAKVELALKNPLAGADAKKKAEEDKTKIQGIIEGFKTKVTEWQKLLTDLPAKAKAIPDKLKALAK
jgi:hypothetical protein